MPLKVLHKILDEKRGRVSVVGLSNWALDPAKMNRFVHLTRPSPSSFDLSLTAKALTHDAALRRHLSNLAEAYYRVYQNQKQDDFFGLRDFYSVIRSLETSLSESDDEPSLIGGITPANLSRSVLRNFGGRPQQESDEIVKTFFDALGVPLPESLPQVEDLIRCNITNRKHTCRHLLLLTQNDAALDMLVDRELVDINGSTVIIGSDFPGDNNEILQYEHLEKVSRKFPLFFWVNKSGCCDANHIILPRFVAVWVQVKEWCYFTVKGCTNHYMMF